MRERQYYPPAINSSGSNSNTTTTANLVQPHSKPKVSYLYDNRVGQFHYGQHHPMKPHRLTLTHSLICAYDLQKYMQCHRPRVATYDELTQFHSDDYISFLQRINPDILQSASNDNSSSNNNTGLSEVMEWMTRFNLVEDCPVFEGMYDFCKMYAGASMDGARLLSLGNCETAINWSGGLHHAKKSEASGFCYVNDIVLAILEMLRRFPRVLYIDIDVHHGDGVQEAFCHTDRVMTVSFHKYGDQFFPLTGHLYDVGYDKGKYYSVNVPLRNGVTDDQYVYMFKSVMAGVMEMYRPSCIVLQCGADSLALDRLGCFNLSIRGHGACVDYMKTFGVPMLVLGGGGYTIRNVSRCWAHETAVVLGRELSNDLPYNEYYEFFGPDYTLHPVLTSSNGSGEFSSGGVRYRDLPNHNSRSYLEFVRIRVLEQLRALQHAPSVQMQVIPPSLTGLEDDIDQLHFENELEDDRHGLNDDNNNNNNTSGGAERRYVLEMEERRGGVYEEFYDGLRDQDGQQHNYEPRHEDLGDIDAANDGDSQIEVDVENVKVEMEHITTIVADSDMPIDVEEQNTSEAREEQEDEDLNVDIEATSEVKDLASRITREEDEDVDMGGSLLSAAQDAVKGENDFVDVE